MRLETLIEAGLPIWMAVKLINHPQAPSGSIAVRDIEWIMKLAFSNPAVNGMTLWNSWENTSSGINDTTLTQGYNFTVRIINACQHCQNNSINSCIVKITKL